MATGQSCWWSMKLFFTNNLHEKLMELSLFMTTNMAAMMSFANQQYFALCTCTLSHDLETIN